MKKNGFTLIEILAVLILIAVIGLIITPRVTEFIANSKTSQEKSDIISITNAAKSYHLKNSYYVNNEIEDSPDDEFIISVNTLYEEKYLKRKTDKYDLASVTISKNASGDYSYTIYD